MSVKAVMFDLDGTLLNTLEDLATCCNLALAAENLPVLPVDAYRYLVGAGFRNLVAGAIAAAMNIQTGQTGRESDASNGDTAFQEIGAAAGGPVLQPGRIITRDQVDPEILDRAHQESRRIYAEIWHDRTQPYDGILTMLDTLRPSGLHLMILSNKPDEFTKRIAAHFFTKGQFERVQGMQAPWPAKPDPALALDLFRQLAVDPAEVAYIGDSGSDMVTAVRAGMIPVGVTWGFRAADELRDSGAVRLMDTPAQLTDWLLADRQEPDRPSGLTQSAATQPTAPAEEDRLPADPAYPAADKDPVILSRSLQNRKDSSLSRFFKNPFSYLWLLPTWLAWLAQRGLAAYPAWVEQVYTTRIFKVLSWPMMQFSSLFPFSLTEALVVLGPLVLLILLTQGIVRLVRRPGRRWLRVAHVTRGLAWLLSVIYVLFMLMHGLNYARQPVAVSFALDAQPRTTAELAEAATWLAEQAAVVRTQVEETDQGVFQLSRSESQTLQNATRGYDAAQVDWPLLSGHPIRPKGVLLSHVWSYTGITGVYDPWLLEANVNVDQPDYSLPFTIEHEVAHTRGFAREDEANFVAFLTGIYHPDQDYRYSAWSNAWIYLSNALYSKDVEDYKLAATPVSEAMWRDFNAGQVYWKQFEGPVQEAATQANNAYLQANLQEDGVHSYGRMVDLVLAWYFQQKAQGGLAAFEES